MTMRLRLPASILAMAVGCGFAGASLANDDVVRLSANPNNVVMPSVTYNGWNFSALDQINSGNVANLVPVWTQQLNTLEQFESQPLIVGDTMYIIAPISEAGPDNFVLALDLTRNGAIKWEFRPDISDENIELAFKGACCGDQTRGFHYAEGKLFMQTLDGQVISIDAQSGEALWRTQDVDLSIAETLTGVGTVVHDNYIVGVAGGERGVRGRVTSYNIDTGNLVWRYHNMGPNNEVGITANFKPFYADDKVANPALDSWWGDSWRRGGGTVWGYITVDLDADMFHYSTGNCGPWNPDYRREWGVVDLDANGGLETYRNNYCASQLARNATSGELIWAYNVVPQDQWDLDLPLVTPLVDINIGGQMRKTIVKAQRNGYFYVHDRLTGELISEPWQFVWVDYMSGVDMQTGRPMYSVHDLLFTHVEDRRRYTQDGAKTEAEIAALDDPDEYTGTEVEWCPGIAARNWQNDAWSPDTGLLYTITASPCRVMIVFEGEYVPGEGYTLQRRAGVPVRRGLPNGQEVAYQSELQANDPVNSRTVWSVKFDQNNGRAPVMATAGNLIFQGDNTTGAFVAYDASSGAEVWRFVTGSGFTASASSYAVGGTQYIAVIASSRRAAGAVALEDAPDDVDRYSRNGAALYVFALAG